MNVLALDLSKASCGWALFSPGLEKPACGTWELGSDITSAGMVFLRLHQRINEIHTVTPLDAVIYEKPRHLDGFNQHSHEASHFLMVGLAAHVDSYCEARSIRKVRHVNQTTWRKHFLGPMKRGTKSATLKGFAIERCKQLGIIPGKHDAAEAVGILDYFLHLERITPPWRAEQVFTKPLVSVD